MSDWQRIWSGESGRELWTLPDRRVAATVRAWKAEGARRALDVGCGVGRHLRLLAQEGFETYGCDPSGEAVTASRETLAREHARGSVWQGEIADVPYTPGFFDGIIAFNSIYHGTAAQVDASMRHIRRALGAGGQCLVTLPSRAHRMYGQGEEKAPHTFAGDGLFGRLFEHGGERGVMHYFSSEDDVRRFFRGFRIDTLAHEELTLARTPRPGRDAAWFRIPHGFFWVVLATADGRDGDDDVS